MPFKQLFSKARYGGLSVLFDKNALFKAVKTGNTSLINHLLNENNQDVNKQDELGYTPLHYAAKYNRPIIAKKLLEYGADINKTNKNGMTPLNISIQNDSDCTPLLLRYDDTLITNTDLYYAIRVNNKHNLYTLLSNQQVRLLPKMNTNIKELDNDVNFFHQLIKDCLFTPDIDIPLCNVADMDINVATLLGVSEE